MYVYSIKETLQSIIVNNLFHLHYHLNVGEIHHLKTSA